MSLLSFNPTNYKILVVDDTPTNLLLLKFILQKEGYQLLFAENGEQALQIIQEGEKPNVILLDVMMPDKDGYEVAEIIRKDPSNKNILIFFLTALSGSDQINKGLTRGGNAFITKPFNRIDLLTKIQTALLNSLEKQPI